MRGVVELIVIQTEEKIKGVMEYLSNGVMSGDVTEINNC